MLGHAFTTKIIKMFSDGTPWNSYTFRDVSSAFIAAIEAHLMRLIIKHSMLE